MGSKTIMCLCAVVTAHSSGWVPGMRLLVARQGRRCGRLAVGIRLSVSLGVIAETVKALAGLAVSRLALAMISLAEIVAA